LYIVFSCPPCSVLLLAEILCTTYGTVLRSYGIFLVGRPTVLACDFCTSLLARLLRYLCLFLFHQARETRACLLLSLYSSLLIERGERERDTDRGRVRRQWMVQYRRLGATRSEGRSTGTPVLSPPSTQHRQHDS
jgi:hypothetical protein